MPKSRTKRTKRIAALNDELRTYLGARVTTPGYQGQVYITAGIDTLPLVVKMEIWTRIRSHDQFNEDNDPYGEHDFGAFDMPEVGKIFWKIDYYAPDMEQGSEDPADPEKTVRVLTVMLANEY